MSQTTKGVLLSYLNALLNIVCSLVLVPMLISALTEETYSMYKVIQSLAGSLMMFNLGLGNIAARAVARGDADSRQERENTLALTVVLALAMGGLVLVLGQVLGALLPRLFGDTLDAADLETARNLVTVFSAGTAVHILSDTFRGRVLGREHYVVTQGAMSLFHILRFAAMAWIARTTGNLYALAGVDLALYALLAAVHCGYSRFIVKERGKLTQVNREVLEPIAGYAAAIVIQALVTQANTNLDAVILGATGSAPRIITMYASALTVYTVYRSLVMTLSGMYLARASRVTAEKGARRRVTDFVIGPGRIQAAVALGLLAGFALLGRDFIALWIGEEYLQAWPVVLTLMAAAAIPLTQSTCVTLLDATLNRLPRSLVLLGMAAVNAGVSILLVKPLGYWGPVLGTVSTTLLGEGVLMNLYYKKSLGLELGRMFREIFSGTLLAALVAGTVCLPLAWFRAGSFPALVFKGLLFLGAYLAALWQFAVPKKRGGDHGA